MAAGSESAALVVIARSNECLTNFLEIQINFTPIHAHHQPIDLGEFIFQAKCFQAVDSIVTFICRDVTFTMKSFCKVTIFNSFQLLLKSRKKNKESNA